MQDEDIKAEVGCLRQSANLVQAAIAVLARVPHFSKQIETKSLRLADDIQKMSEMNLPQMDTPLNVALCGVFSSGKSSLINALLGDSYCPTQRDVTTKQCTCFVYGEKEEIKDAEGHCWTKEDYQQRVKAEEGCQFTVSLPFELLKKIHIWDVPGLNAPGSNGKVDEQKSNTICGKADCIVYLTNETLDESDEKNIEAMTEKDVIVVLPKCDHDGAAQRYKNLCNFLDSDERKKNFKEHHVAIVKTLACGGFAPRNPNNEMKERSIKDIGDALLRLHEEGQKRRTRVRRRILDDLSRMAQSCQKHILWLNGRSAEWRQLLDTEMARFHDISEKLNAENAVEVGIDVIEKECMDLLRNVLAQADKIIKIEKAGLVSKRASIKDIGLVSAFRGINTHIVGRMCRELHVDELPADKTEAESIVKIECDSILALLDNPFQQFENEAAWESVTKWWTTTLLTEGKNELRKWYNRKSYKLKKFLKSGDVNGHLKTLVENLVNLAEAQSASRRRNLAQLDFFENTLAGTGMLLEELKDLKGV